MNAPIYYVYMLFDTETCQPIYIGKGSGYRIDDHEGSYCRKLCLMGS